MCACRRSHHGRLSLVCGNEEKKDRTEVVETVGIDLCSALRFVTLLQQLANFSSFILVFFC